MIIIYDIKCGIYISVWMVCLNKWWCSLFNMSVIMMGKGKKNRMLSMVSMSVFWKRIIKLGLLNKCLKCLSLIKGLF